MKQQAGSVGGGKAKTVSAKTVKKATKAIKKVTAAQKAKNYRTPQGR